MHTYSPNKAIRTHIILLVLIIGVISFCSGLCISGGDYWSLGIFSVLLIINLVFNIKGIRLALKVKRFSAKHAEIDALEALILKDKQEGNEEALHEHIKQAQKLSKELQEMVFTGDQKQKK